MKRFVLSLIIMAAVAACAPSNSAMNAPSFALELTESAAQEIAALGLTVPVTGRAYVIITRDSETEPREQVGVRGVPFWGQEVRELAGGDEVTLVPGGDGVIGHPLADFSAVPPGDYTVQAFLNVFTTFRRSDGNVLEMHLNSGAGQSPWEAPGNAASEPQQVRIDPGGGTIRLAISRVIPPTDPVPEGGSLQQGNPSDRGELVRFVKIRSDALSTFWDQDMYIGANVLLPTDYARNSNRRYPVLYLTGHFPGRRAPYGYSDEPEEERARYAGFSEFWRSRSGPKMILVSVRDANPYHDTRHSLNTANVGPYGDGGWEALAIQILNPDFFGGTWGWCPDPVDFHWYQIVNVYDDDNAYETGSEWAKVERPNNRRPDGTIVSTIRQEMYYERAVGPNGRSGGQWAIWEALFSPVGPDGYAAPIWDRVTGEIDHEVAEYWREHWDLTHHLVNNWSSVGPSLAGKLHIAVGDMDSYYLNNAVELMEQALSDLTNPSPRASFEYGRKKPHCWIGYSPWRRGEDLSGTEFVRVVDGYLKGRGGIW
jgi:hypothetical protein